MDRLKKRLALVKPGMALSICFAILVATIAWCRILVTPGFVMHGDITFPTNIANYALNFFPLWNQHPSYSNLDELDRLAVMVPLLWAAKVVHLDIGLYSRLFLYFIFLSCAVTIIIGKRKLEDIFFPEARINPWARMAGDILASIIFCYNPWSLYRISAPFFAIAYAMSPLVVAYQLEFLKTRRWIALAVATLAWTAASGSPQYTIFFGALSLMLFCVSTGRDFRAWLAALANFAIVIAAYVGLNLYWIGPAWLLIHTQDVSPGYTLNWTDVQTFSSKSTFLNVISGTDMWVVWWTKYSPLALGWFGVLSAVVRPCFFVAAMFLGIFYRRKPLMPFFAAALLVLVVLLEGAHGPFRFFYHAIVFGVIPQGYGWIIRAPEKFGAFFWLFISLLIGIGCSMYFARRQSQMVRMTVVASALILVAWLPLVEGTLLTSYVPVPIPESYNQTAPFFIKHPGKVLVLADYEENARWVSGDAIFKWAPTKMAGFVVARSLEPPTFGGYHFQNPFSFAYSFIKAAGPERLPYYAAILGTKYVLIERDIEGNDAWYERWKRGLLADGAQLLQSNDDFSLFSIPGVRTGEYRSGPYAVLAGDAEAANVLVDRFGRSVSNRNLFFMDQHLSGSPNLVLHASLLLLNGQTLHDVAASTFNQSHYVTLFSKVFNNNIFSRTSWAHYRLNNPDEEDEAGWNLWQTRVLQAPETWPLDLGLGIVSTAVHGLPLRVRLTDLPSDADLYVRFFAFSGAESAKISVRIAPQGRRRPPRAGAIPGSDVITTTVGNSSPSPVWHWEKLGRITGFSDAVVTIKATTGYPALGPILIVPHGAIDRRAQEITRALRGKIYDLGSFRSLAKWPAARLSGSISEPQASLRATGSVVLDEDYDAFWRIAGDHASRPLPGWLFATAFAPVSGDISLSYLPQTALLFWWHIEIAFLLALCIAIVIAVGISRYRHSRRR